MDARLLMPQQLTHFSCTGPPLTKAKHPLKDLKQSCFTSPLFMVVSLSLADYFINIHILWVIRQQFGSMFNPKKFRKLYPMIQVALSGPHGRNRLLQNTLSSVYHKNGTTKAVQT